MKASDIMHKINPLPIRCNIKEANDILQKSDTDFLPVIDEEEKYVGIVSKDSLLKEVLNGLTHNASIKGCLAQYIPCVWSDTELEIMPICSNGAVVLNSDNQVKGIIRNIDFLRAFRSDIDDLKDRMYAVIESAHNGILAVDLSGNIILANRVVAEILEIPVDQLIGHPVIEYISNSLMPKILLSGQSLYGEKIVLNTTPILANYSPVKKNDVITGAVCVFQDLSSMDAIHSELDSVKKLTRELGSIINSSYDGIYITDGECLTLNCNEAYQRITGISASEVVGRTMHELVEAGIFDHSVSILVMEGRKNITITQTIKKTNKQVLVTGNPIFDENGYIFRIVTNVRDVTELYNLQNQLQKSKEQTLLYETELRHLRSQQAEDTGIIYRSICMSKIIELSLKLANVDSTVLITGESGTGKELLAKLIHKHGKGINKPFIKINCAAIPEQLLESELFGYDSGAFTGAKKEGKPGLFELAHNGTLFLDEVAEMPLLLQSKLLRVLQERQIIRVGGTKPLDVNVRIIAATNRDLPKMVKEGNFRGDLYYRLMVIPIELPPLRDRKEDIPLLVKHFVDTLNNRYDYKYHASAQLLNVLSDYPWPGNIRELSNIIERLMITTNEDELSVDLLPETIYRKDVLPEYGTQLQDAAAQAEAYLISKTYEEWKSWTKVAEILGVNKSTIYRKALKHGLLK
ncbi:sigma 54-interacting transcriptional regulator [Desulfosporosinus metallidurans]|uniref:Response regulator of zinc sigma-54-dependent two-component system n=1 Tax=Desulfosporosinus metallidurans TaxID=1888891 RepID=A0A1Q8QMK2_9FIRM|nr:sigma 54-interacting transcriptional regulator [Desulfosporosinus metallidurans]OLN28565.1 Response regulator of zinc sigma-54-dependent two-component system [Desulfosporosinus metallidurans]